MFLADYGSCVEWTLEQAGLRIAWKEAGVVLLCHRYALDANISPSDVEITRREWDEALKALRVWIASEGNFTKELAEQEVSAWRLFYSLRHLL